MANEIYNWTTDFLSTKGIDRVASVHLVQDNNSMPQRMLPMTSELCTTWAVGVTPFVLEKEKEKKGKRGLYNPDSDQPHRHAWCSFKVHNQKEVKNKK